LTMMPWVSQVISSFFLGSVNARGSSTSGEVRVSLDYPRSRGRTPAAGITYDPGRRIRSGQRQRQRTVTALDTSCAVARVAPRTIPVSNPSLGDAVGLDQTAAGVGARHGWPVRRIAQQRTRSFRASATMAFFFEAPLACSRSQVVRAHGL
jgi:hypothetical protein